MKILIFSDSHGRVDAMRRVMRLHYDADAVVFLGDGIADARACEREFDRPIWQVAGNCDDVSALYAGVPSTQPLTLEGHRILLTHGHRFGVKNGTGALAAYAADAGYEIVLFGHTHEAIEQFCRVGEHAVYLFNPGSLGAPRYGHASYGLLHITPEVVLFSHGEVPEK